MIYRNTNGVLTPVAARNGRIPDPHNLVQLYTTADFANDAVNEEYTKTSGATMYGATNTYTKIALRDKFVRFLVGPITGTASVGVYIFINDVLVDGRGRNNYSNKQCQFLVQANVNKGDTIRIEAGRSNSTYPWVYTEYDYIEE